MRPIALISIVAVGVLAVVGAAAVPETMSYQGLLRDAVGDPVPDSAYHVTFRLWTQDIGGALLWEEIQTVHTSDGVFDAVLGSVAPLTLEFDAPYWLGVSVGGDPELTPRTPLTSAPYARHAGSVEPNIVSSVDGVTNDEGNIDLVAGSNVTITPNDFANTITISATGGGDDGDWTISGSDVYRLTGKVGIGTASPANRLHVNAADTYPVYMQVTNAATGSTANDGLVVGLRNQGQPTVMDQEGVVGLVLGSGGSSTMTVYPASVIVSGDASVYGDVHVDGFDMDTGAVSGHVLTADASGNGTWQAPAAVPDNDWTISGNNIYKASGNVSIGTTSSVTDLFVDGDILVPYGGAYYIGSDLYKGIAWNSATGSITLGDDTEPLEIYAGSTSPRATLTTAGNLGIGLTNPTARLHVNNDAGNAIWADCTHTTTNDYVGVFGQSVPVDYYGVGGSFHGGWRGIEGWVQPTGGYTYVGGDFNVNGGSGTNYGVYGITNGTGNNYSIYGYRSGDGNYAGYFVGNAHATGTWTAGAKAFKIDHPLDPENKVLMHSCVESPDMKNIYDGVVVLDAEGAAWVEMPEWFEALNMEFRYQLTCVGGYAPVYVDEEIRDNRFRIAGGTPGLKVSWQVTGVRHDAYAEANRIPVEQLKPAEERGLYIHPTAFGRGEEASPDYQRRQVLERKEAERE